MKKFIVAFAVLAALTVCGVARADSDGIPYVASVQATSIDAGNAHVTVVSDWIPKGANGVTVTPCALAFGVAGQAPTIFSPSDEQGLTIGTWQGDLPFAPGGEYQVQIVGVQNDAGGVGSCPDPPAGLVSSGPVMFKVPPLIQFTQTITGLSVRFTDTSASVYPTVLEHVEFQFGDGAIDLIDPGEATSHIYTTPGDFQVIETATDTNGLNYVTEQTVTVAAFGGSGSFREHQSLRLSHALTKAFHTRVAVFCVTSWGNVTPEQIGGKRLGLTIVGSHETNVSSGICKRELAARATGLDLLVSVHEAEHAIGVKGEKIASCRGYRHIAAYEKQLHMTDKGQRAAALAFIKTRWKCS